MAKLGRKEKKDRNQLLVQKKEDLDKTYRELGDMFNITRGRACQIYKKYKDKYTKVEVEKSR